MQHVFWLIPDRLAGRTGPVKAPWRAEELRAAGFDLVLNLSETSPDETALRAAGLASHWEPLPTDVPATARAEAACVDAVPRALAVVLRELSAGRRVMVHCYAGQDRTGLLLAAYLVRERGLAPAAAIARVRTVRELAITAPGWEEMALRVLVKLGAKN